MLFPPVSYPRLSQTSHPSYFFLSPTLARHRLHTPSYFLLSPTLARLRLHTPVYQVRSLWSACKFTRQVLLRWWQVANEDSRKVTLERRICNWIWQTRDKSGLNLRKERMWLLNWAVDCGTCDWIWLLWGKMRKRQEIELALMSIWT